MIMISPELERMVEEMFPVDAGNADAAYEIGFKREGARWMAEKLWPRLNQAIYERDRNAAERDRYARRAFDLEKALKKAGIGEAE